MHGTTLNTIVLSEYPVRPVLSGLLKPNSSRE